jgi:hypothetical protein
LTAVKEAGIDTWSVCWYLEPDTPATRAMEQLATEPGARSKLLPDRVADHRVGWFPGTRLLFAEGHPGGDDILCPSHKLPGALETVSEGLRDLGIIPPRFPLQPRYSSPDGPRRFDGVGFGGIRRLDSTVNLEFERPVEGLAALSGVAAIPVPRMKTQIMREVGGRRVETVYLRGTSGKRVLGRWYDKGVESGAAARGLMIRPEDQRRYDNRSRLCVEAVASGTFVRDQFVNRFEPLWRASKGVMVATPIELAERLGEMVDEGLLTARQAKDVAGWILLEQAGQNRQSRATWYRCRRRCADLGLVVADGTTDPVEVELQEIIEQALDAESWGRG